MRYEIRERGQGGYYTVRDLCRINDDETEVLLGTDCMEPEDVHFTRDLAWVPLELNCLAGVINELKAELQRTYEVIESHARLTWAAQDEAKRLCAERDGLG